MDALTRYGLNEYLNNQPTAYCLDCETEMPVTMLDHGACRVCQSTWVLHSHAPQSLSVASVRADRETPWGRECNVEGSAERAEWRNNRCSICLGGYTKASWEDRHTNPYTGEDCHARCCPCSAERGEDPPS